MAEAGLSTGFWLPPPVLGALPVPLTAGLGGPI